MKKGDRNTYQQIRDERTSFTYRKDLQNNFIDNGDIYIQTEIMKMELLDGNIYGQCQQVNL